MPLGQDGPRRTDGFGPTWSGGRSPGTRWRPRPCSLSLSVRRSEGAEGHRGLRLVQMGLDKTDYVTSAFG
jgi:hypothetical protein